MFRVLFSRAFFRPIVLYLSLSPMREEGQSEARQHAEHGGSHQLLLVDGREPERSHVGYNVEATAAAAGWWPKFLRCHSSQSDTQNG